MPFTRSERFVMIACAVFFALVVVFIGYHTSPENVRADVRAIQTAP